MGIFSKSYEELIVKALGYIQLKKDDEAETLLKKAIKKKKNISDAYEYLGILYFKRGDMEHAKEYLKTANQISGGMLSKLYFNQGLVFYKRNLIEDALNTFVKVNMMDETNKFARYYLGQIFSKTGNYKGAIDEYLDILKKYPDDIQTLESLGYIYFDLKIADKGIEIFKKLLKLNPNVPIYYFNLASLYKFMGDYAEAERYFKISNEKDPDNYLNYLNLAEIYKLKKDFDKAEEMIKIAIEKFPMDFMLYYEMGLILMEKKDYDKALSYFKKTYDLNNTDIYTVNKIAQIYFYKKNYEEAEKFYKHSLSLNDKDPYTHFKYAELLLEKGNKEEAKKEFNKVLEIEPNYIIAKIKLREIEK